MALNKEKVGAFIQLIDEHCNKQNLTVYDVSGINADKEFFEPSKQVGADTSKYKIVPHNAFACNLMHVGRDVVLPIARNNSGANKIVSPAYSVFSFDGGERLLPEYFFMMLKSSEMDRFFWFHTDSSVRDGMSWEDFCNTEITFPNIETQRKYVAIYRAMQANQRSYEKGLDDLKLVIDATLDRYKKECSQIPLSEMLEEIDVRNTDEIYQDVMGININKQFIPSNLTSEDKSNYKIVSPGQFAYSSMQTGRDECIRIALLQQTEPIIVSPAYSILKTKCERVSAKYIMMWFSRYESDRYGWFLSDGSIRANLDLPIFFNINIPVPSSSEQQSLIDLYDAYLKRCEINERLKDTLKKICPILIRGAAEAMANS